MRERGRTGDFLLDTRVPSHGKNVSAAGASFLQGQSLLVGPQPSAFAADNVLAI